jgi:hypothetical protein
MWQINYDATDEVPKGQWVMAEVKKGDKVATNGVVKAIQGKRTRNIVFKRGTVLSVSKGRAVVASIRPKAEVSIDLNDLSPVGEQPDEQPSNVVELTGTPQHAAQTITKQSEAKSAGQLTQEAAATERAAEAKHEPQAKPSTTKKPSSSIAQARKRKSSTKKPDQSD